MMTNKPDVIYNTLFTDLHESGLWADQKLISDAIPNFAPEIILKNYNAQKKDIDFDLKAFFEHHFTIAKDLAAGYTSDTTQPVKNHIENLWPLLERKAHHNDLNQGSSLIPLPHPYIVPGGRFNEIYYWDSYFTMLGLKQSKKNKQIEGMVKNFDHLINSYGHIPNGNRTYFLSRSQPPFFAAMVQLLAQINGKDTYLAHLDALQKEYNFWMSQDTPPTINTGSKRVVTLNNKQVLNRYYDNSPLPRQEMHQHDILFAQNNTRDNAQFFLDMRSACESGWDFSCRWFKNKNDLHTIQTSQITPVDLNCLLFNLEKCLATAYQIAGDKNKSEAFETIANERAALINATFWNEKEGYYFDYNFVNQKQTDIYSLAGIYPLFFNIATPEQASQCAEKVKTTFLRDGGVVSAPYHTGQQWDAPNGWAPLQYITVKGLLNYGFNTLALEIAQKWVNLNDSVFKRTGKMMEKYNVEDTSLLAGGGEYKGQEGFGWTNGVYLELLALLEK